MIKLLLFISVFHLIYSWSDHDTSTLKLLQILHRHGDRTPTKFVKGDPFGQDLEKYWPIGKGQLTLKGKHRMYSLGQFFRKSYSHFFNKTSPKQVYVRSSIGHRCIESAGAFLAGALPPAPDWDWSAANPSYDKVPLGSEWQPFPIETFMPKDRDTMLVTDVDCHKADKEYKKIQDSDKVTKFLKERKQFLEEISKAADKNINHLDEADSLYQTMIIEARDFDYWWTKYWTKEQQTKIMEQLKMIGDFDYETAWASKKIQALRSGILVEEIYNNMKHYIEGTSNNRFYEYSAHDTTVAPMLHLLGSNNNKRVPFGSTVIFELHQNSQNNYFVKIYYLNETYAGNPHLLKIGICSGQTQCSYDDFHKSIKEFFVQDFDDECDNKSQNSPGKGSSINGQSNDELKQTAKGWRSKLMQNLNWIALMDRP